MKSERILILNVDDYEAGRYATTRVLQQAGFDVHEAANGEEALTRASKETPDLVILDINLPDIDGFEVCRRLKEEPATRSIPVLQLSAAYTGTENRIKGLELGADGYLAQPVEPRELVANVRALLRMKAAQEEASASRQRLQAVVDAFGMMLWGTDGDGKAVGDRNEWSEFTGQTREQVLQGGWLNALHPDDREPAAQAWQRSVRNGERYEVTYRVRDKFGVYHYMEARGIPVFDANGRVKEWIGFVIDVDDRKRAEEFETVLGATSQVLSSSLDYTATLTRVAELIATHFADYAFIDIVTADGSLQNVAAAHRDKQTKVNATWPSQDVVESGKSKLISDFEADGLGTGTLAMLPLIARGNAVGVLGFFTKGVDAYTPRMLRFSEEIAHRVALAVDNTQLFNQAVAGNKAKSDFLAVMSHELRTPLNAILGYTDLLKLNIGGDLSDKQSDHVNRIDSSARHLLTLIDEILTFSRLEAGKETVDWEDFDIAETAREAVAMLLPIAQAKNITLEIDAPKSLQWHSDGNKVRQILLNLIGNAIKFTETGGIDVSVATRGDDVVLKVKDSGIGIDPTLLQAIFEPFRQVKRKGALTSGTGLGLSVSRQLAQMLGGELTAESAPGAGSLFTLTLSRNTNSSDY